MGLPDVSQADSTGGGTGPGLRPILELALVEARRYGDDDTIWVRELVQNARDAAATRIAFRLATDGVVVEDDGSGMSRATITDQLLRLFSSSKGRDEGAAGCFGVGFWSVLRAGPRRIEVDSHDGRDRVGVVIDLDRAEVLERTGRRQTRGTSIRLVGAALPGGEAGLRAAVQRHAAMVDGRRGGAPALILVTAAGDVALNRPFSLDDVQGVVARAPIEGPGFRGFVGLSATPRVELFHHGLRVVEATSLSALVPSLRQRPRRGLGLVVRVDVPAVKVLVDRRTVVEDETVRALVAACDDAATRLERRVLDDAAPLPLLRRGVEALTRLVARPAVKAAAVGIIATAVGLGLGLIALGDDRPAWATWWSTPAATVVATTQTPVSDVVDRLSGPRIDTLGQTPAGFALATRHVVDDLLAIDVREIPDDATGLRARDPRPRMVALLPPSTAGIVATAQLRGRGLTVLPSSLIIWPARAFLGAAEIPIGISADGLPVVDVPASPDAPAGGTVDVFYGLAGRRPPATVMPLHSDVLAPFVEAGGGRADLEAVRQIGSAVASAIRYSAELDDAQRFDDDDRPLIERAIGLGMGDCDVINTVFVRALQQAGFPARLVRGFVVRHDAIATELHAWAEVFVAGSWHLVDASPPSAMPVPSIATATTAGAAAPGGLPLPASPSTPPPSAPTSLSSSSSSPPASTPSAMPRLVRPPPHDTAAAGWRDPVGAAAAVVGLVAGLALVLLLAQRRSRPSASDDDVTDLLVAGLQGGAADHLGLLDRPIVPTSNGFVSLTRARALAGSGRLVMSRDGARPAVLHHGVRVLSRGERRVLALGPWLPRLIDVDAVAASLGVDPDDDLTLGPLQRRVDRTFATVVLRPRTAPGIEELHVRTADGRTHQILVGPDVQALPPAALWARLLEETTSLWRLRGRS